MVNLLGLSTADLAVLIGATAKKCTASQLATSIYKHGKVDLRAVTNLPLALREKLEGEHWIGYPRVKDVKSADGTRKWLLNLDKGRDESTGIFVNGQRLPLPSDSIVTGLKVEEKQLPSDIETVFIPRNSHNDEGTLCISSQVGCALACTFCFTGTQKFSRNLSPGEIVGQVMHAMCVLLVVADGRKEYDDFPYISTRQRTVRNVVLMGQGEPLLNWKRGVKPALKLMIDELKFPPHSITLSTSGIAPLIPEVADMRVGLAISLHATRDELRDVLVPINKSYPLAVMLGSVRKYLDNMPQNRHRKVTFEYVMLRGVNDTQVDLAALTKLCLQPDLPCMVNLIPWNSWEGAKYFCSTTETINRWRRHLTLRGVLCTVRESRGSDVMAACGQLKSSNEIKATRQVLKSVE